MLAVFVNCFTVIVGGLIGVLFSSRIKESLSVTVQNAAGVITLVLGFEMAFQYESIICLALSLPLSYNCNQRKCVYEKSGHSLSVYLHR